MVCFSADCTFSPAGQPVIDLHYAMFHSVLHFDPPMADTIYGVMKTISITKSKHSSIQCCELNYGAQVG